ncbi:MAG: ABC transporter ATP-binding protein [Lachnospiraceae bacterium]
MIEFRNISKKYKEVTVLSDISFQINTGELVTIIGSSGCGKTTTLKMINRLIEPTQGTIYIDDEDISTKDVIKLRRNMGYVIQQTGLFPHMTVRENIEIIPRIERNKESDIFQKTLELMEMVGLETEFLDRYPIELSGGQQQRVGVARAFATDPNIILMDEPFSALDPITRVGLQDELIDLQSKLKKTIVFVTHDMDEAIRISDRIGIMDQGEIIQFDTPENILKNPKNDFISEFVGKKRIWTAPEYIKVEDIMTTCPVTCSKNITLIQCMEIMRSRHVDSLMVVDAKTKRLEGIVNANEVHLQEERSVKVEAVMNTSFVSVLPQNTILDVLKIVQDTNNSTIPVADSEGTLEGLITKSSLVTTFSRQYME